MTASQELSTLAHGEGAASEAVAGQRTPHADRATEPRIVGLDLSLTATGVARRNKAVYLITSTHADEVTWDNRDKRLRSIRNRVMQSCENADVVIVEGPSYASVSRSVFDRAGLFWLVYRALRHRDIAVAVVSPKSRAKYACGSGNASKDAVLTAAVRRFSDFPVDNNNEADALWLMAMGYDHYGHPLTQMPETHRAALTAVDWPELGESQQRGGL